MKKFAQRVRIYKSPLLRGGLDIKDDANKIICSVYKSGKEVNIQAIISRDEGKGNCQRFIKDFQKDLNERGLMLVSSTPISEAWEHICKKYKITIYR